jgi:hypothetical protein
LVEKYSLHGFVENPCSTDFSRIIVLGILKQLLLKFIKLVELNEDNRTHT